MATNAEQLEKEMQTLRAEVERLQTDLGSIVGTAGDLAIRCRLVRGREGAQDGGAGQRHGYQGDRGAAAHQHRDLVRDRSVAGRSVRPLALTRSLPA